MSKRSCCNWRSNAPRLGFLAVVLLVLSAIPARAVVLYAVSGDGAAPASTLFALDPTTGAATAVGALGHGDDGEGIAFRPDDRLLYHTSGGTNGSEFFETINPVDAAPGPNLVAADTYGPASAGEIFAIAWYEPLGVFLASDVDLGFYHVTPAGQFTLVGSSPVPMRGFAVLGEQVFALDPTASQMFEVDPVDGSILATRPLSVDGVPTSGNGLAAHPDTGVVFAIVKNPANPTGSRLLATLNVATGQATSVGSTGLRLAGISFRSHAVLYGLTGDGASPASALFTLDPGTGVAAFAVNLGNGGDGECLAFHSSNGLLYHSSGISNGSEYLEAIDPVTLAIGPNLASGNTYGPDQAAEITAMAWYPPLAVFLACDSNLDCFHVTSDGQFMVVGSSGLQIRGFAVVGTRIYGVSPFAQAMYEVDPATGAVIATLPLSLGGLGTTGNALVTSPDSGVVFGILKNPLSPSGGRLLVRVDVATGQATTIRDTGLRLAALSFGWPATQGPPSELPALDALGLIALALALVFTALSLSLRRENR